MKSINKFLGAAIVAAIALFTSINVLASFSFGTPQRQAQPTSTPSFTFANKQPQAPQQPVSQPAQKNLNWNSMEFKDYFQVIKESTENIKMLSDKVAVLEDAIKVMQTTIDTLKDTVSQNYSTTIKMLNEALKK